MRTFIKYISFVLFAAGVTEASAAVRSAETYSCTAFNPITGYARIEYKAATSESSGAVLSYGLVKTPLEGGKLSYDAAETSSFPRTVFLSTIGSTKVEVFMDLLRPEENEKETLVSGVTYVPVRALVANLTLFTSYAGWSATLGFIPVPAGYVPTSIVTCKLAFR